MFHSIYSPLMFILFIILLVVDRLYLNKIKKLMTPEMDAKVKALNKQLRKGLDIKGAIILGLLILGFIGIFLKGAFAFAGLILIGLTMLGIIYLSFKLNLEKWRQLEKDHFPKEITRLQRAKLIIGWILTAGVFVYFG